MSSQGPNHTTTSSALADALPSTALGPADLTDTNSLLNGSEGEQVLAHKDERELSERELRRLFEDEEIERFLALFTDYVSEVSLLDPHNFKDTQPSTKSPLLPVDTSDGKVNPAFAGCDAEDEWVSVDPSQVPPPSRTPASAPDARCISEHIAYKYLLPTLPPGRPRPDRFTMGQLRLTVQRLYLVIHPAYSTLFSRVIALATWKSRSRSTVYCILFWTLWYRNLLMPAFFARVLYSLMRRKLLPYPTLAELRERRREAARSEELGEQIFLRLKATSSSSLMEAWRLFRVFTKPNKNRAKAKGKTEKRKDKIKDGKKDVGTEKIPSESTSDPPEISESLVVDEATVLDSPTESKEEGDFKKALLYALNDIADLHERVKNVFLWRVPSASASFAALLAFLFLFTAFLPAKYIVKLALFILGFLYWHVVPIIASLPPPDRSRLPPLFENSQTDAEYAMALISQRIARGEDVRPLPRKLQRKPKKSAEGLKGQSVPEPIGDKMDSGVESLANSDVNATIGKSGDTGAIPPAERPRDVDWQKWGERAANVRDWAVQGRRMVSKNEIGEEDPGAASDGETRTFPAHHKASPGMLTLTHTRLLFTPITSARPKICIALDDVRGVKKTGINAVPGLSVKWHRSLTTDSYSEVGASSAEESGTVEERFLWVGGRDEVFARLVGWGGRKWLKV